MLYKFTTFLKMNNLTWETLKLETTETEDGQEPS